MSTSPSDAAERDALDEVRAELRRQARAALSAQVAAEACLDAVQQLRDALPPGAGDAGRSDADAAWCQALLPVIDGLDRIRQGTRKLRERAPRRGLLGLPERVLGAGPDDAWLAWAEGLDLLASQLEGALTTRGVSLDRRVGIVVDPERHRVVETRPTDGPPERVVEVMRAGLSLHGRCLREAEVAASRQGKV